MKRILFSVGLGLSILASGVAISACGGNSEANETVEVASFQCPMDCEEGKTYEKAGICPVCEMELKAAETSSSEEASGHSH